MSERLSSGGVIASAHWSLRSKIYLSVWPPLAVN